ncbi:hypothetical protein [Sphingobium sp.]|uniref:hypothetical protein n=1 Tax=Sphingobium sp. TaxID=1912891 RepID=UPI002B7EE4C4|nr:hypothetical protein [Sphingobium sp.]HUD91579.1 hypothetical protein [Sphingobium sp.]
MTIETPLAATLGRAGAIMQAAHDPWWVIASAAVALHGVDAGHVADVDILLSVEDAERILPGIGVTVRPGPTHAAFRSTVFGTWTGAPLPVEFMAGFVYRKGAQWVPVQPATRQPVEVEGVILFIPERRELARLIMDFGRPKDMARAEGLSSTARHF